MGFSRLLRGAGLLLSIAGCAPPGTDTFEREEQTITIDFARLSGTSRTDLWSTTRVNMVDTIVHSRAATRWDALTLPELDGAQVVSVVSSAKNEAWVSTFKNQQAGLWLVAANGGIEDHSSEIPATARDASVELMYAGGTLFATQTATSNTTVGHVYRRTTSGLQELTGLEPSVQFFVLAAKGADDLFIYQSLRTLQGSKLVHYVNGVANDLAWPDLHKGAPTIMFSATGELWFLKSEGTLLEGPSGLHGDALTPWTAQGWPVQSSEQRFSHLVVGMTASAPGKLAALVRRNDPSATTKETERSELGVNFLDAQGKVTVGPRLVQCLTFEECAAEGFVVLGDGSVIIAAGKLWFTGPVSSLQ